MMALTVYVDRKVYTPEQSNKQPLFCAQEVNEKMNLIGQHEMKIVRVSQSLQVFFLRLLNEYFVYIFN